MKSPINVLGVSALSIALLLGGCKTLQEVADTTEYKTPACYTLMDEDAIRYQLIGTTVKGESNRRPGNYYVEYYSPDGHTRGTWNGEPYKGTWAISGSVFCGKYTNSQYCGTLSLDGDQLTWISLKGEVRPNKATVYRGNVDDL